MAFAVACVAAAAMVRIGLGLISPDSAVFASFYSATLVAALVAGPTAGALAAGLGAIVAYSLFVPPDWNFPAFDLAQVGSFLLYVVSSAVIVWAAASYRGLLYRLRSEQDARRLLNRELAHRIKNTLATVQAIVGQSLHEQPEVRKKIGARIAALGTTNDMLLTSGWHGATLRQILLAELAPYDLSRFRLTGRDVPCSSSVTTLLNLVFHELATNAAKYGALTEATGRVEVSWTMIDGRLQLQWNECGGPAPQPPSCAGFGTKLLRGAAAQLNGSVDIEFAPPGLRCRLSMTLPEDADLKHECGVTAPLEQVTAD